MNTRSRNPNKVNEKDASFFLRKRDSKCMKWPYIYIYVQAPMHGQWQVKYSVPPLSTPPNFSSSQATPLWLDDCREYILHHPKVPSSFRKTACGLLAESSLGVNHPSVADHAYTPTTRAGLRGPTTRRIDAFADKNAGSAPGYSSNPAQSSPARAGRLWTCAIPAHPRLPTDPLRTFRPCRRAFCHHCT